MFTALLKDKSDGVMIPIPQYPLYSALLQLKQGAPVPYFLDELNGWQVDTQQLQNAYDQAALKGINTKAMVIINPGNPTGQVLSA